MSKEEIALKYGLCNCDEAYTSRGLTAPDCHWHSTAVDEAMDEYAKELLLSLKSDIEKIHKVQVETSYRDTEPFVSKQELIQLIETKLSEVSK